MAASVMTALEQPTHHCVAQPDCSHDAPFANNKEPPEPRDLDRNDTRLTVIRSPSLETNAAPRNPPRRRRFQSDSGWDKDTRDSSQVHGQHGSDDDVPAHEYTFAAGSPEPNDKMHTRGPRRRMTDAQGVSPPSSPELEATSQG